MNIYRKLGHKWQFDDPGISADVYQVKESDNNECLKAGDDDDVFLTHDDASDDLENNILVQLRRASQVQDQPPPLIKQSPIYCPAQWSVTHRCIECAWKKQRGGRPKHPPPPISPGCSSPQMLTLQSLSTTRDSGYEPSPTSAFSFTFSDDEEIEASGDHEEKTDISKNFPHLQACGITPPINIPARTFGVTDIRSSRSSRVKSKCFAFPPNADHDFDVNDSIPATKDEEIPNETNQTTPRKITAVRKRSKSAPEFGGNELVLPRTPLIIRNTSYLRTPFSDKVTPVHGRNYSLPVTTPDGRPLLAPPLSTPSSRASREGLIDLAEEDPEGSVGHRRRVLVLALPDLIVDARQGALLSPSAESASSSCLSRESSGSSSSLQAFNLPVTSGRPDSYGRETVDLLKPRPAWRRPRALSCDVTMEVEVGQGLRRIADEFSKETVIEHEGGVWRQLHNSIVRRLSLGAITPLLEASPSSSRGTHSLPASPSQPCYRNDSDFDEFADFSD